MDTDKENANKTSPGTCGCAVPDTDTDIDIDEDGTPDCIDDDCIYDDPTIISICDYWYPFDCAGCSGRFYKVWKYCEELCLDGIDYCLTYSDEKWYEYDGSTDVYGLRNMYQSYDQWGVNSSNTFVEIELEECNADGCAFSIYLNKTACVVNETIVTSCLECEDGQRYCIENEVAPLPSDQSFFAGNEVKSLIEGCVNGESGTTSGVEMNSLTNSLPQYVSAFFNHGA